MDSNVPDFVLFLGRFHPLVVHLPIGFLLFAFLLEVVGRFKNDSPYAKAVPLALLAGAISALVACILGYMLSQSGDYEGAMLDTHLWFGVATTAMAFLAWLIRTGRWGLSKFDGLKPNVATLTLIVLLLGITGHYGGNLTHGSDYLVKYAPFGKKAKKELPPIASVGEARVYDYLVDPILQDKCASCHNSGKKKGGLSYETYETLLEGGENGPALVAGNVAESEMIRRVQLPQDHDDFMPPDGKTPLTEEEEALLVFWIEGAQADDQVKIDSLEVPENILAIASSRLGLGGESPHGTMEVPSAPAVDLAALTELEQLGFKVRELVHGSNLFDITLPEKGGGKTDISLEQKLGRLQELKPNIVWLALGSNELEDKHLRFLQGFENLTQLKLENNPITDEGVTSLHDLPRLESLNLYGTRVSKKSLAHFPNLSNLKRVFVWNTEIAPEDLGPYADTEDYPKLIFGS